MINILVSLVAVVTVGFLLLCGGFYLFLKRWTKSEARTQQREAAERVTYNRIMAASRPSWTAQRAKEFNIPDGKVQ